MGVTLSGRDLGENRRRWLSLLMHYLTNIDHDDVGDDTRLEEESV